MTRIRVQISDDYDVVVAGIKSILESQTDIEVGPFVFVSEPALFDSIREFKPHVLLLDAKMPGFDVLTALAKAKSLFLNLKVIIVTSAQDPQLVRAAASKGADGYLLKEEALSELLPMAIRAVKDNKRWFSPQASQSLLEGDAPPTTLSKTQLDVLRLMVAGCLPEEIAVQTQRSLTAVYNAQLKIREKLNVHSNEQAIVVAIRERIVPVSDGGINS